MYLAVLTTVGAAGGGKYDFITNIAQTVAGSDAFSHSSFVNLFKQIAKMITILGLLSLGLVAGKKMGAEGADFGLKMINGVQKFALGALTGGATGFAMGAARGAGGVLGAPAWGARKYLGKEIAPGVTRGQSLAAKLARVPLPGFSGIAKGLDQISTPNLESTRAQYKGMSDSLLMATAKGTSMFRMNAQDALGITQELASKKLLGKMTPDELRTLANKGGSAAAKEIYKVRPDFGTLANQKEYLSRLSPKMIEDMESDLLLNPNINAGLTQKHIEAIASGSTGKQDAFLKGVEARLESIDKLGDRKDEEAEWLRQNLDQDLDIVFGNSALQPRLKDLDLKKLKEKLAESKKSRPVKEEPPASKPIDKQVSAEIPAAPAQGRKEPEKNEQGGKRDQKTTSSGKISKPSGEIGIISLTAEVDRMEKDLKSSEAFVARLKGRPAEIEALEKVAAKKEKLEKYKKVLKTTSEQYAKDLEEYNKSLNNI